MSQSRRSMIPFCRLRASISQPVPQQMLAQAWATLRTLVGLTTLVVARTIAPAAPAGYAPAPGALGAAAISGDPDRRASVRARDDEALVRRC